MLTLSMIVKNEEKYLRDCLNSVQGLVDEIIIVDTGSTDNTKKIAEQYGAKIFDFVWINDFSAARNFALSKSSGDWILYLDADERVNKNSFAEIKKLVSKKEKKAYYCRIINIDEISNRPSVMSYVRLFANSAEIKFEGKVHEQIERSLLANGFNIESSDVELIHIGYNLEKEQLKNKAERNLKILTEEFKFKKNGYIAFQIAQSLHILDREKESHDFFNIALNDDSLRNEYKALACRSLAVKYAEDMDLVNAEKMINKSLKYDGHQPLTLLAAAKIFSKLSNYNEAINCVKNAIRYNKQYLAGKKSSSQNILVDQKVIIYSGLNLSLLTDDFHDTNYFLSEWRNTSNDVEFDFFESLIKKKILKVTSANSVNYITDENLELLFSAAGQLPDKKNLLSYLDALYNRFNTNAFFLNKYGLFLLECAEYDRAETALTASIEINPNDYSSIFYLISVYIHQGNIDKIFSLIDTYRDIFATKPDLLDKLNSLEQKLKSLV